MRPTGESDGPPNSGMHPTRLSAPFIIGEARGPVMPGVGRLRFAKVTKFVSMYEPYEGKYYEKSEK